MPAVRPATAIRLSVLITALALTAAALVHPAGAHATNPTTRWQGTWTGPLTQVGGTDATGSWPARDYFVYQPPATVLPPAGQRSLVIYLHGTTQTATQAALASTWNDVADRNGFIVVYPQESDGGSSGYSTDGGNAARAWAWGQAAIDDRNSGEVRTIAEITRSAAASYGVDPRRVYVAGLSAGAIMAGVMAASYPDLYHGVASWAGCAYMCSDPNGNVGYQRMGSYARVVPGIFFAGSTDYLVNPALTLTEISGWTGMNDLADNGQADGSVSRTPIAGPTTYGADPQSLQPNPNTGPSDGSRGDLGTCVYATQPKGNNPCPGGDLGWSSYPYTVTDYGYTTGACAGAQPPPSCVVVESWYIHGVSHNYAGGSTEGTFADPLGPDTTTAAWNFFVAHGPATAAKVRPARHGH